MSKNIMEYETVDLDDSDEDIPSAGCIYGKYDGNGKWICHHDLYGTDLSAVQDHY